MRLDEFATKLSAKNHFVKASFGGFQGSGKTRTATEFIIGCYKDMKLTKPVLILDNEKAPEKPPSPPNTSGRIVFLTCSLINSTDLYPASKLTPAAA